MTSMRAALTAITTMAVVLVFGSLGQAAEVLSVPLHKSHVLKLASPATVVSIGNPEIANAAADSPRVVIVTGRAVGETNLLILDGQGNQIAAYDVVVVSGEERTITIHRGADSVSTLSCNPRCAGVANPGTETAGEGPSAKGKGGAAAP